jgi:hypothetical protein
LLSSLSTARLGCSFRQAGYAVIFLTRTGSVQPFAHELPMADMADVLERIFAPDYAQGADLQPPGGTGRGGEYVDGQRGGPQADGAMAGAAAPAQRRGAKKKGVMATEAERVLRALVAPAGQAHRAGTLLRVPFTTVFEYLGVRGAAP